MLADGEQMPVVAGDQNLHFSLNRAGKDQVIVRIARHGLGRDFRRRDQLGCEVDEELLDRAPAFRLEAELPGENSLQLYHRRREQDEFQSAIDRLLENAAWRPGGDEGRNQDVGVAGDSQG